MSSSRVTKKDSDSPHSALTIDELIPICDFLERPDLAPLLTVSRSLFYHAAPRVWLEILGAQPLLNLLPESTVEVEDYENLYKHKPLDALQLSRFNMYAPFVRIVNETGASAIWEWESLAARIAARPLLPNLFRLSLDHLRGMYIENPRLLPCVAALSSSKLVEFRMPILGIIFVSPHHASQIIQCIAHSSHNLQRLHLVFGGQQGAVDRFQLGALLAPIALCYNLRFLKSSHAILDSRILWLLGSLPQLESIAIWSKFPEMELANVVSIDDLVLPVDSFPALRHLAISQVSRRQLKKLWETPALVQGLVSTQITFGLRYEPHSLENICQGSPHLTELNIDTACGNWPGALHTTSTYMRALPLRRLKLNSLALLLSSIYEPLISALPNVTYLELSPSHIDFVSLVLIASNMPFLQYLNADFHINYWPAMLSGESSANSPSTLCLVCDFVGDTYFVRPSKPMVGFDWRPAPDVPLVLIVARVLHLLWPNGVRCEPRNDAGHPSKHVELVEMLSHELQALHSPTEGRPLSSKTHQKSWLYDSRRDIGPTF
ncbi:hypothetical protein FRC08_003062 [Ceratobasidium sp. 394]|nr:hypothetical protein FRC08_003062 [Ceratobasidium sp. 394]